MNERIPPQAAPHRNSEQAGAVPPCATPAWERPLFQPSRSYNSCVVSTSGVFLDGHHVIDCATGDHLWTLHEGACESGCRRRAGQWAAVGDDMVAFAWQPGSGAGLTVEAHDPRTGALRWRTAVRRLAPLGLAAPREELAWQAFECDGFWTGVDLRKDLVLWKTSVQADPVARERRAEPPPACQETQIGVIGDLWVPDKVALLDARNGQVLWRNTDPAWSLVGVSSDAIVMIRPCVTAAEPQCDEHIIGADRRSPRTSCRDACAACRAEVTVRVLERSSGDVRWEHTWRSTGRTVDWGIGFPAWEVQRHGGAVVCQDLLLTGEGDLLRGRSLADGTVRWSVPVKDLNLPPASRYHLAAPSLPDSDQPWTHWDAFSDYGCSARASLLVHGATGTSVQEGRLVWSVLGDTVLERTRDHSHVRGLRLPDAELR